MGTAASTLAPLSRCLNDGPLSPPPPPSSPSAPRSTRCITTVRAAQTARTGLGSVARTARERWGVCHAAAERACSTTTSAYSRAAATRRRIALARECRRTAKKNLVTSGSPITGQGHTWGSTVRKKMSQVRYVSLVYYAVYINILILDTHTVQVMLMIIIIPDHYRGGTASAA